MEFIHLSSLLSLYSPLYMYLISICYLLFLLLT